MSLIWGKRPKTRQTKKKTTYTKKIQRKQEIHQTLSGAAEQEAQSRYVSNQQDT